MLTIYNILMFLIYGLIYLPIRLIICGGSQIWRERFGLEKLPHSRSVWIHAASVGEVRMIRYLIEHLQKKRPALGIHISVVSPAGYNTARQYFNDRVSVSFFPFDLKYIVSKTLEMIDPRVIIMAEAEIWPNFLLEAKRRDIPVILANGRMSEKSFKRLFWFRSGMKRVLSCYDRSFYKSAQDAKRYNLLGSKSEGSVIAGDMKFDAPLLPNNPKKNKETRRNAGAVAADFLFIAGSTRSGEEEIIADIFRDLNEKKRRVVFVLAPRHLHRLPAIKKMLRSKMIEFSAYGELSKIKDFILIEEMGLLTALYAAADFAFVGGTLVDTGGHNLLEPVWVATPTVFGPDTRNVQDAARYIVDNNYGVQINSAADLKDVLIDVISGRRKFNKNKRTGVRKSPTKLIGDYVLKFL